MVFARYVMFSEVYWHHGVRAATAMLQRAFYLLHGALDVDALFRMTAAGVYRRVGSARPAAARRASCSRASSAPRGGSTSGWPNTASSRSRELYQRLARRPYPWLAACAEQFAALASTALGRVVAPHEILFDAPPRAREVQFDVEIYFPKEDRYRRLGRGLAGGPHAGHRAVRRLREAGAASSPIPAWWTTSAR